MNFVKWLTGGTPDTSEPPAPVVAESPPAPPEPVTGVTDNQPDGPVHEFGTQYRIKRDPAEVIAERMGPAGIRRRIGDVAEARPNTARARDAMARRAGFGEVLFGDD